MYPGGASGIGHTCHELFSHDGFCCVFSMGDFDVVVADCMISSLPSRAVAGPSWNHSYDYRIAL